MICNSNACSTPRSYKYGSYGNAGCEIFSSDIQKYQDRLCELFKVLVKKFGLGVFQPKKHFKIRTRPILLEEPFLTIFFFQIMKKNRIYLLSSTAKRIQDRPISHSINTIFRGESLFKFGSPVKAP